MTEKKIVALVLSRPPTPSLWYDRSVLGFSFACGPLLKPPYVALRCCALLCAAVRCYNVLDAAIWCYTQV